MKTSPPKPPVINQIPAPIPPPASLLLCSQMEPEKPEPVPAPLPAVLQNILNPSTTELINTVVSQLRQNNAETENRIIPRTPSVDNFVSDYARDENFVSEYTREDFTRDDFTPSNIHISDFNNFTPHQPQPPPPLPPQQVRRERLNFEPPVPLLNNQFNQIGPQNQRFMSPLMGEAFNDNFSQNRPFTPMPQGFPQSYNNFQTNQNAQSDIQPLDYYPPNAPIPSNQYNSGPPLLSPEVPHFHNEQKPTNFGMIPNHDPFGHNEDMRWRQEDTRFPWERRDQDHRLNRDPRTYREYREMRESRDPRVMNRDPRDNRDQRDTRTVRDPRVNRDLRENRDSRDRDPRLNKDRESRDFERDRSRFRDGRSQSRDDRPSRYDSKFDRMYSRTNRDRSRSRSRSRYSKETFTSPLDSLYSGKEEHKTGKGYGVQNFRIPKIKKEDEEKEQSTKVSSTNEEVCDVQSVNDDSSDSTNNEVTGNDIETEVDENKLVIDATKEDATRDATKEDATKKDTTKEETTKESGVNDHENETTEKDTEVEKTNQEPPKLQNETEEAKIVEIPKPTIPTQLVDQEQAKPADQTILAQFFANLLGSQNKKEKKTALYSLISTFSDSFSEKELTKITKIIKADEDAESSEEEEVKKSEPKPDSETTKELEKEAEPEETHSEDTPVKMPKRKTRRRIRRISSTASIKDEKVKEEEIAKTPEPPEVFNTEEESVVVSVGERIKSRKRASITPPKPKKKCKTELDMLHEDIQDMFIRDGVLTASGKRMCRLLKSDPNALTTPQTTPSTDPPKLRKKPGPKPKPKLNQSDMKTVKNIRILLPKIPDSSLEQKNASPRRSLRSSTKAVYAESDEDDKAPTEEESIMEEGSFKEDSDAESTDTEKDKISQASDNTTKAKMTKRKRGKGWASGNIPSNKKKKKKLSSVEESTEKVDDKSTSAAQPDTDKSFVVPDKNYYIDFVTNKSHECRLCDYHGRFITTHYKSQHPESEILTSRFSPAVAQEAIEDSNKNLVKYENMMVCGSGKFHFTCRFCAFNTSVPPTIFYDHITTHTGEYRHVCPMCDFSASSGKTLKSHMSNVHNNIERRVARKSYRETIVFGYMCGECNYVQLTEKNVEEHINIFHLQKPTIYKVNMSTTFDPEVANLAEKEKRDTASPATASVEEKSEESLVKEKKNKVDKADKPMLPPQLKKRPKAAPKSVKDRLKAKKALAEKEAEVSDTSSIAESESSCSLEPEKTGTPEPVKPVTVSKRRLTREVSTTSEEEVVVSGRSRRAAKDKATEKLKTLMELTENGGRKKSYSETGDEDKNKSKQVAETKTNDDQTEDKKEQAAKVEQKSLPEKKEEKLKIKKEIELNVFTCKTDIQEENKKIEQERLQLMDELNKSVGNRTSLNFVDKLCNRLSNNDIIVKQEPRDDLTDSLFPTNTTDVPLTMPVLEKNLPTPNESAPAKAPTTPTPPPKKPVLQTEDMQVSNPSFDVTLKNNKIITDMIQKLKGKVANISDDKSENSMTLEDVDYDNEGPPPLTHVNKLPNVKPADVSTKTMLIGGLVKVIKYPSHLMFSCLVPPCLFSTENREAFQKHCSEAHKLPLEEKLTLCDMCGMELGSAEGSPFLENIFKHALEEHADFMSIESKPEEKTSSIKHPNRQLRLRKLSGDALSVIKKDWEEEIDKTSKEPAENNKEDEDVAPVAEAAVDDGESVDEPTASIAELEVSDENPFPFKIAGVMSLAEPVPPLTPITKPALQMQATSQLVVKEAKLNQTEVSRPRKTPKAMAKFIASVSDLYKCPHYYCLFSTNFRDFLEKHLKAHKVEHDMMIPCVYCDMKTPWEHVPMHIDIRHAHCRFACSYCLYRAVLKEYVFLHQDQMHPENDYSVIALPQPKHSKKWAIADIKVDPKTLCEPYRCTPMCGVEFLFENEFRKHLMDVHKSNFIQCGYKNCTHRVQANKMSCHWSLSHSISMYQCGHCKMNGSDIKRLYKHFALFHQGLVPDILIRKHAQLQDGVHLGYSPEAFSVLRKIITIPSNISGENKAETFEVEPATVPVILPSNTVPYGVPTKATLQVVTSLSQNITKSVIIPGSKSVINRAITLVTSKSPTNTGNILLMPNVTTCNTLSGIVLSPQTNKQVTSVAAIGKTLKVVPSVLSPAATTPPLQEISVSPPQKDNEGDMEKKGRELDLTIEPLEHITLSEDNSQSNEEADTCEVDPLSLEADADITDISKSAADSSGDESDKLDKSKKEAKSGLMSYQLYRCAFCDISFSNSVDFKRHATFSLNCRIESQVVKPFVCVHCEKQLKNPHVLVEHVQCHGVLRFTCSLCGSKFATIAQTRNHIKNRHNITHTSMTPLNPAKQSIDIDEFVVRPKLMLQMGAARDASPAELSASSSASENVYTPETIEQIPMRHILSSSVKCGLCSYTTKVRTNMVRHLQFHSEEKVVPDTAPVNPVPCLEKNEKMFDKMINLASSSHANSRMGGAKPDAKEKETENYPEFVPSHCRYVCCAHGCSYICPEEGNLRHHLIALHDSETSFTCVHCKADLTPTDADSLIKHFKFHGLQLYKCQYCSFVHNLKHKIEKHISDGHLDLPIKIITVRFMEAEPKDNAQEPSTSSAQSTPVPPAATKLYKPWRCCMCKYKSGTQEGIQNHVLEKHEVDSQFKCALCTYKTNDKETFTDHFKDTHDNQGIDIIYAYRKMEEDKEKESETFDTTPLWQRDRPRVRHIRGILFDEASPAPVKSPKKSKSATPMPGPSGARAVAPSPGPSGVKAPTPTPGSSAANSSTPPEATSNLDISIESVVNGTAEILKDSSISDDFFHTVNKIMRESNEDIAKARDSMVIVIEDEDEPIAKNKDNKDAPVAKNRATKRKGADVAGVSKIAKISDEIIDLESSGSDSEQDEFSERNLKLRFGGFGMPLWKQFKCPMCNMFKSKRISDFVFHLFKEMKVFRFKCKVCTDESITYRYMHKHVSDHHQERISKDEIVFLPPNEKLLAWLQMVIREQSVIITQNYPKSPQPAAAGDQDPVQCDFCSSKFRNEQEKNEHCVSHWTAKPYNCSSCSYSSYLQQDVLKHFRSSHEKDASKTKESEMMVTGGPTVERLLKISDEQHEQEAQARLLPKVTDVPVLVPITKNVQDPLADIPVDDPVKDPLDVPVSLICDEELGNKEEDAALSDSDLIIVTKTDSADVPTEGDVYCCEYCAFMTNSEVQVISHISGLHEHMHINFKKLNRARCEDPKEHVGCSLCSEVGSEVKIRLHHMEKHDRLPLYLYRYQCALCPQRKKFLKFMGLKVHFNRVHQGAPMQYTSIYGCNTGGKAAGGMKTYKCPICPYVRNFKPNAVNNIRQHVKQHFKAFMCGICYTTKYKTRADVLLHFSKEHPEVQDPRVEQDMQLVDNYNSTMAGIIASAVEVAREPEVKNTAKKSTSTPQTSSGAQEYTFYGNQPEEVDLSKIMTSVEVNGMHLNMSAERLAKIFDLNVVVALEDCNLSVNLSSVFDS
ncbi:uncharacterized protein LOC108911829 [Anoplophora glabripennis]|nr:uncharacterized protein LOC108911829 [Anoplophora glabripennis]